FDDLLFQASYISGNDRQPKTISQEKYATLKYAYIWKDQDVGRFEIKLRLLVWNMFNSLNHPLTNSAIYHYLHDLVPINLVPLRFARDNQTVISVSLQEFGKGRNEVFQSFVRRNLSITKHRFVAGRYAQHSLRVESRHSGIRDGVVNPKRDNAYLPFLDAKIGKKFLFHPFRMNKNMVHQLILDS